MAEPEPARCTFCGPLPGEATFAQVLEHLASPEHEGMVALRADLNAATYTPPIDLSWNPAPEFGTGAGQIVARQDLGPVKYGAVIPVTAELLADASPDMLSGLLAYQLDRTFRPWRYPDPNPFPMLTPFPRLERWRARSARLRARLARTPLEEDE